LPVTGLCISVAWNKHEPGESSNLTFGGGEKNLDRLAFLIIRIGINGIVVKVLKFLPYLGWE
jgi:hypothetical protein